MGIGDVGAIVAGSLWKKAKDVTYSFSGLGVPPGEEDLRTVKDRLFGGDGSKGERLSDLALLKSVLTMQASKTNTNRGIIKDYNLYTDGPHIYSGHFNVTKMYSIEDLPEDMALSMISKIRDEMAAIDPGVRVNFISTMDKHHFEFGSSKHRANENTWRRSLQKVSEESDVSNAYSAGEASSSLALADRRQHTVSYFKRAQSENKSIWMTSLALVLTGTRGEAFDKCERKMLSMIHTLRFTPLPVDSYQTDFLAYYTPFRSMRNKKNTLTKEAKVPLTGEILTQFTPSEQGTTGDAGICLGIDVMTHMPVMRVIKRTSTDAENWLFSGATGSGKSFLAKLFILQLLQYSHFIGTIIDVEGFEYNELVDILNDGYENMPNKPAAILDVSEKGGRYLDTIPLSAFGDLISADEEEIADTRAMLMSATRNIFQALLEISSDDKGVIEDDRDKEKMNIIAQIVDQVYKKAGVAVNEPATWHRSQELSFHHVYRELKAEEERRRERQLSGDKEANLEDMKSRRELMSSMVEQLSLYFEEEGIYASKFRKRYSLEEITSRKLLVLSMGMAARAIADLSQVDTALVQIYTSILVSIRTKNAKTKGLYNLKVWEEFQRWSEFPGAKTLVKTALTGGRKLGDVNLVVTNDLAPILANDQFAILSNLKAWGIGAIPDDDVLDKICDKFNIHGFRPVLSQIKDSTDLSQSANGLKGPRLVSDWDKSFLVSLGDGSSDKFVVKMHVNEELENSKLMKTGTNTPVSSEEG